MLQADGSRVLLDCGPGVLGRLREHAEWPDVDAIAITHFHLDHWGDLVPWVWGSFYLASRRPVSQARLCGSSRAAPSSSHRSGNGSASPTCSSARSSSRSTQPDTPFRDREARRHADAGPALHAPDVRVPRAVERRRARRTRATRLLRRSSSRPRATPTSSSAKRRSSEASSTASRAVTSRSTRRSRRSRPRAQRGFSSPTVRASCRPPSRFELAYDGLELEV